MTVCCVPFALGKLTDLPVAAIQVVLKRYVEDGWARFDDDGLVGVKPDGAIAVLIDTGCRCFRYTGDDDRDAWHTVAQWGKRSANSPLPFLLFFEGHALVAEGGMIFDCSFPAGVTPADHPNAGEPVPLAYRVSPPE